MEQKEILLLRKLHYYFWFNSSSPETMTSIEAIVYQSVIRQSVSLPPDRANMFKKSFHLFIIEPEQVIRAREQFVPNLRTTKLNTLSLMSGIWSICEPFKAYYNENLLT